MENSTLQDLVGHRVYIKWADRTWEQTDFTLQSIDSTLRLILLSVLRRKNGETVNGKAFWVPIESVTSIQLADAPTS